MKLSRTSKIFINYFLGPLLFVWLSWSIYRQVQRQPGLEEAWQQIKRSLGSPLLWNLAAVVVLMFINWSIEAVKWRISVRTVQPVSFSKAMQAVFSGVSFSVTTPNRIGEYFGRMIYMQEGNRLRTISITIVSSISQLIITLLAGCIGLFILKDQLETRQYISPMWMSVIMYGVLAVLLGLTLFYFRLSWMVKWVSRLPGSKRFFYLVQAIQEFDTRLLVRLLALSLLRFAVFILQYGLLFVLFGVRLSAVEVLWSVSVAFLVLAIIPTIAIAELAQRGKVVTAIVGLYSTNELGITFATAGIWFINLILPAIIGSLLILRMRKIVSAEQSSG